MTGSASRVLRRSPRPPRLLAILIAALPAAMSAQHPVHLVLNHLQVVLDSATYHDIRNAAFLREQFAAGDTAEDALHGGLLGLRLFGKYNWITLAHAGSRSDPPAAVGDVVISLSTEDRDGLQALAGRGGLLKLSTAPGATDVRGMGRDYLLDSRNVAMLAGPDSASRHVHFEIMQYSARESATLSQVDSQPGTAISNARFLARYYDPHRLFEYLSAATLAIPVDEIAKIAAVLEHDSVSVLHEGEAVIIKLDGFTLRLIPPWTGAGVKQLQFALTRPAMANPVYRFGPASELRFGPGPVAVWDFAGR